MQDYDKIDKVNNKLHMIKYGLPAILKLDDVMRKTNVGSIEIS